MKAFDDLAGSELAALTDAQVEIYCKLSAAEAGVPILFEEPVPFTEQPPAPDAVVYELMGCTFTSREKAEALQTFLLGCRQDLFEVSYDYNVGYSFKYVKGWEKDLAIKEQSIFSPTLYVQERARLSSYASRKAEAEKATAEWSKAKKAYDQAVGWILARVGEARSNVWRQEENQRRFDEYLALAEGDEDRAWTFFCKARLQLGDFRPVGAPSTELALEQF